MRCLCTFFKFLFFNFNPVQHREDRFPVVSLGIFSVAPTDATMCPGVDSASENEYQGFLLG